MTKNDLINRVSAAYPDDMVALCWDFVKGRPVSKAALLRLGDTLAVFIALELNDTFEESASDEAQIAEAVRVLETAQHELNAVCTALQGI